MTQVHFSDGDKAVLTGWDRMLGRFFLTVTDAPTGDIIFDCEMANQDQEPAWIVSKLFALSVIQPATLEWLLKLHRDLDMRNVVVYLHHIEEHRRLNEQDCGTGRIVGGAIWQDVSAWG